MAGARAARLGQLFCLAGAGLGAVGLLGWMASSTLLTAVVPGQPAMQPNTAVALLLAGVAGALRRPEPTGWARRTASVVAAGLVLAVGALTLAEYACGIDLHIDQLMFAGHRSAHPGPYPGRPSPPTALALVLLATAVLALDSRPGARARPSEWLALSAAVTAFTAILGQLFGAGLLYRITGNQVIGVAVPTAVSLFLTSTGLLLERPQGGVMRLALSRGPGGVMLRRLGVLALLAPAVFGLLITQLVENVGSELPLVLGSLAALLTVVSLLLLALTAVPLDRAHEALERARAQSQALIEQASDGLFVADLDGRYTDVNDTGCRMLGYARDEIVGKSISDLIPAEDRERLRRSRERLDQGDIDIDEWSLFRKDGTLLPVEVSAKILPDGRWQGLVRDISERKLAEEAARASQAERLRRENEQKFLAELGPAMAATLDSDAILTQVARLAVGSLADLCIVDLVEEDGEMRRLKAATRDPARAWICEQLTRIPLDRTRPHLLGEALETGRPVLLRSLSPAQLAALAQSDEHLRLLRAVDPRSLIAVPLLGAGKVLGAIALLASAGSPPYGPADLRLAEELAQRAALSVQNARLYRAAQRATQARDDILGIVAHDLRNPLATILLQAEIFRTLGWPEPDSRYQKALNLIERAASRMNRLIQDLLDVTRMEAGGFSLERRSVPAAEVIADSVEAQRPRTSAASLELSPELTADLPEVWADRDRLMQVFENLIGNAVKFTGPGGRITAGAKPGQGEVLFWVRDSGAGIAPENLAHVFDRFWQAHRADRQGTGLGLPIVKGLVEAHGGRVWVDSTPGWGTTVYFTIPTPRREVEGPTTSVSTGP
jgi:PAS domain S-box-containing protein